MMDDLDWILDTYGSVPEYYRSRSEETYEDHIRSEKLRNMEEAIGKADNTRRHWVRVPVWEGNDYTGCRLMTDREKMESEYRDYRAGSIDDMNEWRDMDEVTRKELDPEKGISKETGRSGKKHRR